MTMMSNARERIRTGARRRVRRFRRWLAGPQPITRTPPAVGMVEEFSRQQLSGWVAVPDESPAVRVRLMLNKIEVAAAWATIPRTDRNTTTGQIMRFDLRLRDVWSYAGPHDRLTVKVGKRTLPISGHGVWLAPEKAGRQTATTLAEKLADGYVFARSGRLQLSKKLDSTWQQAAINLYQEVRTVVAEAIGRDVFVFYGTLLGAVREGTVIGHDDDFDAAYLSEQSNPRAAALELMNLGLLFVERGFHVRCAFTSLHIYSRDGSGARVDLFHTYFGADDLLCLPFGQAGDVDFPRERWTETTEVDFCGGRALLPPSAEHMAALLYGSGWRSPQPGFDWTRDLTKRDWQGVLSIADVTEVYWADFYARQSFDEPSPFFGWVASMTEAHQTVIDLGCGDGRDSLAFAAAGRTVVGLDRSTVGIRNASERAADQGVSDRTRFVVCDLGYEDRLAAELRQSVEAAPGPVLFYLRFILHSVSQSIQATVLRLISELARPGDVLAAEFRTDQDEKLPKTHNSRYRRFQKGPVFTAKLTGSLGFEVLATDEGTGLSPYRSEDPSLYRVVARKT